MTREEAIEMLKKDKEQRGECFISDALDMAIQALEQEPQCTEHPCLGTLCRYYKEPCDECNYKAFTELYFHTDPEMVEQEPCDDAVDRQDVISVINILADKMDESGKTAAEQFISAIKDMR